MRHLVSIRTVSDVQDIPEADRIQRAKIDGWWCVVGKGEFTPGDKCVYFEVDSLLPCREPFLFMERSGRRKMPYNGAEVEGYRVRTMALRKQISQGLALPLSKFPGISDELGADVTEFCGVLKYEQPIPAELSGNVKGPRPSVIPKTDEERIQNLLPWLDEYKHQRFYVTEKLDGTSCTMFQMDTFGVCGREWEILEDTNNTFWRIANELGIRDKLPKGIAIQGEVAGPGIQKNPLLLSKQQFFMFYAFDIAAHRYLELKEMEALAKDLGLSTVPVVERACTLFHTLEELLALANRKSLLNPNKDIEGLVFRLYDAPQKVSFKVLSNQVLLKEKD